MLATKQKIFMLLDEHYGNGATSSDYDSKEQLLEYCMEQIGDDDSICAGCGAGPHRDDVSQWVEQFWAGKRPKHKPQPKSSIDDAVDAFNDWRERRAP